MTTTSDTPEPTGEAPGDDAPYLPPSLPTVPVAAPVPPVDLTAAAATDVDAPFLPAARPAAAPVAATPANEPAFDAKAMVDSQRHAVANPAYGGLPKATPESVAAAKALRAKAQRKRRRNKAFGWLVALIMLGGIGVAGWFAYQAYEDDQDQLDAERAEAQADGSAGAPGALTPLGNQQQVIDALEDVNSGSARPSAGALLDAVDDAQAAVDDINGGQAGAEPAPPAAGVLTVADVRPAAIERLGTRLEDVGGYERHVVDAQLFAADSPSEYARFVALMQSQPQLDPQASALGVLPELQSGEIALAVIRDGERLIQAIVSSTDPEFRVDLTP